MLSKTQTQETRVGDFSKFYIHLLNNQFKQFHKIMFFFSWDNTWRFNFNNNNDNKDPQRIGKMFSPITFIVSDESEMTHMVIPI